jgi:hypothetical protein
VIGNSGSSSVGNCVTDIHTVSLVMTQRNDRLMTTDVRLKVCLVQCATGSCRPCGWLSGCLADNGASSLIEC